MTKKQYKIQSQKGYWFEVLSLFTDECLTKEEMEQYKHELAQRLADLVKNNGVLDDVMCDCEDKNYSVPEMNRKMCFQCKNKIDCI